MDSPPTAASSARKRRAQDAASSGNGQEAAATAPVTAAASPPTAKKRSTFNSRNLLVESDPPPPPAIPATQEGDQPAAAMPARSDARGGKEKQGQHKGLEKAKAKGKEKNKKKKHHASTDQPPDKKRRRVQQDVAVMPSQAAATSAKNDSTLDVSLSAHQAPVDQMPVLWIVRQRGNSADQKQDRIDLEPDCTFTQLRQIANRVIAEQQLKEGTTLVDSTGAKLTETGWQEKLPRWAILCEKGASFNIKNKANITPVPNIINSFIVDIPPLVCLTEIIDNAIEATSNLLLNPPEKGRRIVITTNKAKKTVTVEDNGVGMGHRELEEFGKLGHTTRSAPSKSRVVAPPYHLSSEFGRYGIGAKSAGLGLGSGYLVESKRKEDGLVHYKAVSKDQIMSSGWEAEVGLRSPENGEGDQFTRFTICDVVDQFWEDDFQQELRPFLADMYHFYLHGPPTFNDTNSTVDLTKFLPIDIIVDKKRLRETCGNIKDFIDKASPKLIWPFSINIPTGLMEDTDTIWGFICYYPIKDGCETLPVPYTQLFNPRYRNDHTLAYKELPLRVREPGLNFFWVGRLFPKMERKRLPWMEVPGSRSLQAELKLPSQCYDRIKGAIFFPRSMVATSHKQQFGVNEKLVEYLYKMPKEYEASSYPAAKEMANQFKKLRNNYRRKLEEWHAYDAEAIPLSNKLDLKDQIDGVSCYKHIKFRTIEYRAGDKVKILDNKKNAPEYGEIDMFELDRRGKRMTDNVIVTVWTHEKTNLTKMVNLGAIEKISEREFMDQIDHKLKQLPNIISLVLPKPNANGELLIPARENVDIAVAIRNGYGEIMKTHIGILFGATDADGKQLFDSKFLAKPYSYEGYEPHLFFFYITAATPGPYHLTFTPGTKENIRSEFIPHPSLIPLEVDVQAVAGQPTALTAQWGTEGQDLILLAGEVIPSIEIQQKDSNGLPLAFPENLRFEISMKGNASELFKLIKKDIKVDIEGLIATASGLIVEPRPGTKLTEDQEIELLITANSLSTSLRACLSAGTPVDIIVEQIGQQKEFYNKGDSLPELKICLKDKYGNLARVEQQLAVTNIIGCEPQRERFKIKQGTKILPYRFFEVTGSYGVASFDIVGPNSIVASLSFRLAPVQLRLYKDNLPVADETRGPNGEVILQVEAGQHVRGLEVWALDQNSKLIEQFTGVQMILTRDKLEKNMKKYRFKKGKVAMPGINAAKSANRSIDLDFYMKLLDLADNNIPQLSLKIMTIAGPPYKLAKMALVDSSSDEISCGDRISLTAELHDERGNAIDLASLSPIYTRKLLRGFELSFLQRGEKKTPQVYNYHARNWYILENSLRYDDLEVSGKDICGVATLELSYKNSLTEEGYVKDPQDVETITLEATQMVLTINPGPLHDMICNHEELEVEAGQQLPSLTWRVVDQFENTINPSGGRIVLVANSIFHVDEQAIAFKNGTATFPGIRAPDTVAAFPLSTVLQFRFEDDEENYLEKSVTVRVIVPLVPMDCNVYIRGKKTLSLPAGQKLGIIEIELLDSAGECFGLANMVSLSLEIVGKIFHLEAGDKLQFDCTEIELATLSGSSFPMHVKYVGQDNRTKYLEKIISIVAGQPRKLVVEGNTIGEKLYLDDISKPTKLSLDLHLVDEYGNPVTNIDTTSLAVEATVYFIASGTQSTKTLLFSPNGRIEFHEELLMKPGPHRIEFACQDTASVSVQSSIEPYICAFVVIDALQMRQISTQLLVQRQSIQDEINATNRQCANITRSLQQLDQEKYKLEKSISYCIDNINRISNEIEKRKSDMRDVLAYINMPDTEKRFGSEVRLDNSIVKFKAYESEISTDQRSNIRGMIRDKIKVRNVRLANMLAYFWGFDKLCMIMVEGQDTLKRLSKWQEEKRVFLDLLDISDFEPKLEHLRTCLTALDSEQEDPAFIKFEFRQTGPREWGFQPSPNGNIFPVATGQPSEWLQKVNRCLSKAYFLINCLFIPSNARRWRPLCYKILAHSTLVFPTEAELYEYVSLTKDSASSISLDSNRQTGGTVKTLAYRPHLFEKNNRRTPRAFLEDLDTQERLSKQFLMSTREGQVLIQMRIQEQEASEWTKRLQQEELLLSDVNKQIMDEKQKEAQQKQRLAVLHNQFASIRSQLENSSA